MINVQTPSLFSQDTTDTPIRAVTLDQWKQKWNHRRGRNCSFGAGVLNRVSTGRKTTISNGRSIAGIPLPVACTIARTATPGTLQSVFVSKSLSPSWCRTC